MSRIAARKEQIALAQALGLPLERLCGFSLVCAPSEVIKVNATFYVTSEQVEAVQKEMANFEVVPYLLREKP